MKRRCKFLDELPWFNFNTGAAGFRKVNGKQQRTDTTKLGSTLMSSMLKEVKRLCNPNLKEDWTKDPHEQVKFNNVV